MLISNVFIDCKVKGIHLFTFSASLNCLARQSISIDVLYNREFKSDDEVNISTESKDAEATEEVYIFLENRTNFDCELLGS